MSVKELKALQERWREDARSWRKGTLLTGRATAGTLDMCADELQPIIDAMDGECPWEVDACFDYGDTYNTACGEAWSFVEGGVEDNRVKFCHGCGRKVKVVEE